MVGEVAGERYALLTWLAWELRRLARTTMLVVSGRGEPVLYLVREDGRSVALLAVQREGEWLFVWGRDGGVRADPGPAVARTISEAVR